MVTRPPAGLAVRGAALVGDRLRPQDVTISEPLAIFV